MVVLKYMTVSVSKLKIIFDLVVSNYIVNVIIPNQKHINHQLVTQTIWLKNPLWKISVEQSNILPFVRCCSNKKYWPQTLTLSYFTGQWEMRGEIYPDNPATIIGYWTPARGSGVGLYNHRIGLNNHGNWIYRLNKYPALNKK